jgi:hypothetical protein
MGDVLAALVYVGPMTATAVPPIPMGWPTTASRTYATGTQTPSQTRCNTSLEREAITDHGYAVTGVVGGKNAVANGIGRYGPGAHTYGDRCLHRVALSVDDRYVVAEQAVGCWMRLVSLLIGTPSGPEPTGTKATTVIVPPSTTETSLPLELAT